ncbi:hypothetical protein GCM10011415_09330 [Salipiger pallidus]|uniref:Uncharacterized protein n=1 Tax=Salipiger pallidus TaxID=1775170 RepID=A0A8J3EG43_9RHOB|nr:hypothetical protein GCM10011415_09330 [Salipiger pallidus]
MAIGFSEAPDAVGQNIGIIGEAPTLDRAACHAVALPAVRKIGGGRLLNSGGGLATATE